MDNKIFEPKNALKGLIQTTGRAGGQTYGRDF